MSLVRPQVMRNGYPGDRLQPGDLLASGRSVASIATVGAGTLTGAAIAAGVIARSGPTAAFTDTTDTAWNILQALAGNAPEIDVVPGIAFEICYQNTVAYAMTLAAGAGVILGTNVDVAASTVRDYLCTVLNASAPVSLRGNTTNGSKIVTLETPIQMGTFDTSNGKVYGTITPGMGVSGTGIAASSTVSGLTYGQGTITGFTLSANATADGTGVTLAFVPQLKFQGLRSCTA